MRITTLFAVVLAVALTAGCQENPMTDDPAAGEPALRLPATASESGGLLNATAAPVVAAKKDPKPGAQLGGMIWADSELFGTVGTPATFDGDNGPYDRLFQGAFLDGIGAISESKPGDQDFNGGRWSVWVLKVGVVTDYSTASSYEDLNEDDFEPAGVYFECPLLPRRGSGHDR